VPGFANAPRASIGSRAIGADRRLVAVYARDDGDVHELDLATGNEQRFRRAATRAYRESAPSIELGTLVFVRRGGRRNGTFQLTRSNRLRRIARATPRITVTNGTRFAYATGRTIVLRRLSLRGPDVLFRNPSRPLALTLTRYRMGWLLSGGRVFQTLPFGGSGRPRNERRAQESARRLPATTTSIALQRDRIGLFLDAEAVKLADPPLF
jgi:hypothetical protein